MNRSERIHIPAPKRGRLPRRYEFPERPAMTVKQKLRLLSVLLLVCSALSLWLYLVMR